MRRVTIKDIAKIAGVSYATVSRALSGSSEISETTRNRIIDICKQEGYRANSLARSLICNKTNVIGLIVPEITNPFYSEIALDVETFAHALGYNVMLCNARHDSAQVEELFGFLVGHQVDGIILASSRNEACSWATKYFSAIPTVLLGDAAIGDAPDSDNLNSISIDNRVGGRIGAQYLYDLGHRDILYLGLRPDSVTHQLRVQGFTATMQRLNLEPHIMENPWNSSNIEHGYTLGKQLFANGCNHTAIFAATDAIALGILQASDEFGIDIPHDISLLGFDNISYSALPKISLSTIDQRKRQLSEGAVNLLIRMIDSPKPCENMKQLITPTLVERRSCQPLCNPVH